MDKHTAHIKNNYSEYWETARNKIYGFMDYDKRLLSLIYKNSKKADKILDITCGTGEPFIENLIKESYKNIYGNDIAYNLLKKSKLNFKGIKYIQSDIQNSPFKPLSFDLVYCFHSSWYFWDFFKAFDNIVELSNKVIIIDILNYSGIFQKFFFYYRRFRTKLFRVINNIRHLIHKRYHRVTWNFISESRWINFSKLIKLLNKKDIDYKIYNKSLDYLPGNLWKKCQRIILVIEKK